MTGTVYPNSVRFMYPMNILIKTRLINSQTDQDTTQDTIILMNLNAN